jgi:hypothetical protein
LIAQESIEEAIGHFIECVRRAPDIPSASCLFDHFESCLIDHLIASEWLDPKSQNNDARAILREQFTYSIASFTSTTDSFPALSIEVSQQNTYEAGRKPIAFTADIVIPNSSPLYVADIKVQIITGQTPTFRTP